jgi:hypothetical protein
MIAYCRQRLAGPSIFYARMRRGGPSVPRLRRASCRHEEEPGLEAPSSTTGAKPQSGGGGRTVANRDAQAWRKSSVIETIFRTPKRRRAAVAGEEARLARLASGGAAAKGKGRNA